MNDAPHCLTDRERGIPQTWDEVRLVLVDRFGLVSAKPRDYHVLLDLLGRKRVQLGRLDLVATEARYTLTPDEAATRIGVHVSAVRQAIERHRLPAWKRGGRLYLDPVSCDSYKLAARGTVTT